MLVIGDPEMLGLHIAIMRCLSVHVSLSAKVDKSESINDEEVKESSYVIASGQEPNGVSSNSDVS
eukprot:4772370-Karenia_brevis.AAC.1